jgi:molybdenum-dependent DNA-binding transcriptional regulator ModE
VSAARRVAHICRSRRLRRHWSRLKRTWAHSCFLEVTGGCDSIPRVRRRRRGLNERWNCLKSPSVRCADEIPESVGLRGITAAQLSSLAGIAEHRSFAAAALGAGCTRAAVYRSVRQLEGLTGVMLVESSAGRLLLTRDGERLAQRAQLAAAEMAQACDEVSQSVGRGGGRSVIGAMPLARSIIVPRAVLAFAALRPDHAVSILDGPFDSLLDALRRGYAAVLVGALRNPLPTDDVEQEHLFVSTPASPSFPP